MEIKGKGNVVRWREEKMKIEKYENPEDKKKTIGVSRNVKSGKKILKKNNAQRFKGDNDKK